jgi:predicted metal-dependent hydrolase
MPLYPFIYTFKTNSQARNLSIRITREGEVVVTKPKQVSLLYAESFITKKISWIISKIEHMKSLPPVPPKITRKEYLILKEKAQAIAEKRVKHFNEMYNFSYKRITIRNQKTRWGSCSSKGNLNFNYKIALLSEELVDYIVVHELCHLGQMNHSKKFWDLVSKTIPTYKDHHITLRSKGLQLS